MKKNFILKMISLPLLTSLPVLAVVSCSQSANLKWAPTEMGELDFLSFKQGLVEEAAKVLISNPDELKAALLSRFEYTEEWNWGLKNIEIETKENFFIIKYEFVVYSGTTEEFSKDDLPKTRDTLKGILEVKAKSV